MSSVLINWISKCPKCNCEDILIEGDSENIVFQGSGAECNKCGHKGEVVVYGSEECDVAWDDK